MVTVCADTTDPATQAKAAQLARELGLPMLRSGESADGNTYRTVGNMLLAVTPRRLELRSTGRSTPGPVYADFVGGPLGYRRRLNRQGLLFQAVGLHLGKPRIIDATAGLGRDAFLLAYYGCRVTAIERSPIVAALLRDGLERALDDPEIRETLAGRLIVVCADARDVLRNLQSSDAPDVIYLDPMFPPKKKSALVKKEMRVLRQVVGDDPDAHELFDIARTVARQRIVVKRSRRAPPLGPAPTREHADKTTRYDVYSTPDVR